MNRNTRRTIAAALATASALGALAVGSTAHAAETGSADVKLSTSTDARLLTPGRAFRLTLDVSSKGGTATGVRVRANLPRGVTLKELSFTDFGLHWECGASKGRRIDCTLDGDYTPAPNPEPFDPTPDPDPIYLDLVADKKIRAGEVTASASVTTTSTDPNPADNVRSHAYSVVTKFGTVTGRVWHDVNKNGLQDKGEPGLADADISLWEQPGVEMGMYAPRVLTDANGRFTFTKVPAYAWELSVSPMISMNSEITEWNVGDDDTIDSDFDPADSMHGNARSKVFTVKSGKTTSLDVGYSVIPGM